MDACLMAWPYTEYDTAQCECEECPYVESCIMGNPDLCMI